MKSISNQYKLLKEGKMTKYNFMRSVRTTFPQYITSVTSFDDAVRILRKKSLLSETLTEKNLDVDPKELEMGIKVEKEHTKDPVKAEEIALDHLKEDPKYYTKLAKAGLEEIEDFSNDTDYDALDAADTNAEELAKAAGSYDAAVGMLEDELGLSYDAAEAIASRVYPEGEDDAETQAMIDKIEQEMAGKYTTGDEQFPIREAKSWTNASGKDMYAQFKEIDNLNGQEVLIGIDCEMEKDWNLSKNEAAKIVIKNLKKNPNYYTDYALSGKEMDSIPTIGKLIPGSDKMKPLKSEADLVDKNNGMKSIKGVEKIKASANKASKETNKPSGTISLMSLVAKTSKGVTKMVATGEKMKVVKEGYEDFLAQKKSEETAAETYGGFKKGDKVMVDPEAAKALGLKPSKVYTISNFRTFKKGSMLQNTDAMLDSGDEVNVNYLFKAPKIFASSVNLGKYDLNKLKEMVREVLAEMESDDEVDTNVDLGLGETMDGRDNLTDTAGHQLDELSSQEQAVVDDIMNTLNEGMFSDVLNKVKNYAKKGLLTAAVVASLLSAPQFSQAQQQQIKQVAQTELSATQAKDSYPTLSKLQNSTSKTNPFKINMKGDSYGGAKGQSLNWGLNAGKKGTVGLSVEQSPNSSTLKVILTKGDKSENFSNIANQLKAIKGAKVTSEGDLIFQVEVDASGLSGLANVINNSF